MGGVRPEVLAFLDDIKAHPDDDTPRLIFADWLQEHGTPSEAARGELIRLQLLQQQFLPTDPRKQPMHVREMALLNRYLRSWLGGLIDFTVWRFDRGLLQLETRAEKFLSRQAASFATPENCLYLESLTLTEVETSQVALLDASPYLPYLSTLNLADNELRHQGLATLVRSPNVTRLHWLGLAGNRIGPEGARALAGSPHLAALGVLDLRGNRILNSGARYLVDSPYLQHLRTLRLKGNRISPEGQAELTQRFGTRVSFD
jgi:uncharacterized protein (TIGR02996 family)